MATGKPPVPAPPGWTDEAFAIVDHGTDEDFEKLRGKLGVNLEKTTWDQAKRLIEENTVESIGQLGRHPLGLREYYSFRTKINAEFVSMEHYVRNRVYGYPISEGPGGKKQVLEPEGETQERLVYRPNDFPYYLEDGIRHDNIWSTRPLDTEELKEVIRQHCQGREWCYFINPAPLASIPSMWHAHVLSRPLQQAAEPVGGPS